MGHSCCLACCCRMEKSLQCSFPPALTAAALLGESQGSDSHWNPRVWRLPAAYNGPGRRTMATHTHTLLCFGPALHPPLSSRGPLLMDCFPHSRGLACAVVSQDSRWTLGTALFSFFLTRNLQTVSSSTHYPPSLISTILCCLCFSVCWQMSRGGFTGTCCFSVFREIKPIFVAVVPERRGSGNKTVNSPFV